MDTQYKVNMDALKDRVGGINEEGDYRSVY